MQHLVLTFLSSDRPGLIESVAEVVRSHEGNWRQSRLIRLGGQFAGLADVQVAEADAPGLLRALEALGERSGLDIQVHQEAVAPPDSGRVVHLELTGLDRPGIIAEVTGALMKRGVNVLELETEVRSAPMSGEPLLTASAELGVGEGEVDLDALHDALEAVAESLDLDLSLLGEIRGRRQKGSG